MYPFYQQSTYLVLTSPMNLSFIVSSYTLFFRTTPDEDFSQIDFEFLIQTCSLLLQLSTIHKEMHYWLTTNLAILLVYRSWNKVQRNKLCGTNVIKIFKGIGPLYPELKDFWVPFTFSNNSCCIFPCSALNVGKVY